MASAGDLQEFIGEIEITGSLDDFTLDDGTGAPMPVSVQLTSGDYFIEGYTGEATAQLIEHLQAQIRASHANFAAAGSSECTVSRSSSTGLITISFASGPVTVTWTDAALGTLLGYTGNLSGDAAYAATNTPKGVWRPTRTITSYPGDLTTWWAEESSSLITISKDGSTFAMEGNLLYNGLYEYELLTDSEVVTTSSTVWSTFEKFWQTVVHEGRPVRVLPDRTAYTSAGEYVTGFILPADASPGDGPVTIGTVMEYRGRTIDNYNGFWQVAFKMAKQVTPS